MRTEEFDRVLKTDLYGPFFCCREFIRLRQNAGGGERAAAGRAAQNAGDARAFQARAGRDRH